MGEIMANNTTERKARIRTVLMKLVPELWSFESKAEMNGEIRFLTENLDTTPWLKEMVLARL
jgi:hypothetical protein